MGSPSKSSSLCNWSRTRKPSLTITIGLLKQLNNVSRLKLDTAKHELKRAEYERSVAKELIADKAKRR